VFGRYSFANFRRAGLGGHYPKREYCVQYRETDFNFVQRLMEHEGIHYHYEYDNARNTLVLRDCPGDDTVEVPFAAERRTAATVQPDHITSWSVSREIQPGRYVIDDFNQLLPKRPLTKDSEIEQPHDLAKFEIFDYPGEYCEPSEGEQYAKTRIQELHARYEQFSGGGNARLVGPGKLLKLDHPLARYKQPRYFITSVSYSASAGDLSSTSSGASEFHCGLTAIDSTTDFRPARVTPKPLIQGPQTAFVVGPKDQEIWTDEHGRVKVQFHWDRYSKTDENSSCWVRVAQPIAGGKWGFLGLPRVGHEVVVEFLEGDPDRPLVTGSLYNGELKPPYKLPDHKTRTALKTHSADKGTSENFNELRFEDLKGKEEIYIHAEKDKTVRIKEMRTEWVGKESHLIVKENTLEQRDADHHITLKLDRNEKIGGSLSLDIKQDLLGKAGTKVAYDAGTEIHLKAGSTMVLEAGSLLSLKVGGSFITLTPAAVFVSGTTVMINSGGSAGTGSGSSPKAPKAPKEAGKSEGGEMKPAPTKTPPSQYSPQAQMFAMAAQSGTPFCEICNC
jgi:type VI secretion system secreted protein VgrG